MLPYNPTDARIPPFFPSFLFFSQVEKCGKEKRRKNGTEINQKCLPIFSSFPHFPHLNVGENEGREEKIVETTLSFKLKFSFTVECLPFFISSHI
jgi:hypothetical protein